MAKSEALRVALHLHRCTLSMSLPPLELTWSQGAIISAADIGSFAWSTVPDAYWLASVFWYCSLIFAIAGIFLSSQQIGVLDLLGPLQQSNVNRSSKARIRRYLPLIGTEIRQPRFEADSQTARVGVGVWKPRWEMVFTWQCPMMFLSYSFSLYILGTTVFVCTPLINGDEWGTNSDVSGQSPSGSVTFVNKRNIVNGKKIAAIYLATIAVSAVVFMFC